MYTGFAEVYDRLMSDVDYPAWAAFYTELLRSRGISGGTLCECACGTGGLTLPLQRAGWQVTGADLSQEMLEQAQRKAREEGLPVRFVCQDMRRLQLHHPVDAVLATCDGVNYLLKEKDLTAFLRSAWTALRPGGCLAFDVSTPRKLSKVLGDSLLAEDTPEITYLWQNHLRPGAGRPLPPPGRGAAPAGLDPGGARRRPAGDGLPRSRLPWGPPHGSAPPRREPLACDGPEAVGLIPSRTQNESADDKEEK